jgi:predicted TIM-barrel fold metal-dependent hydrolase
MVADSHTHVASPDTDRYPLAPSGLGRTWWTGGDHRAPALVAAMDRAGVDRAVVVQAVGPYGYDCRYAVDATAAFPDRLALVGAVDMAGADPAGALALLAAAAPLRGVRLFGVGGAGGGAGGGGAGPPTWLADGRAAAVWAMADDLGCSLVATLFARDLPGLRPLVEARPGVPVAVDHAGFPDLAGGPPYAGLDPLLDLADLDAVNVKVSSHLLLDAQAGGGDPADLVDRLAEVFGAGRLAWGSDYPQTAGLTYPQMLDLARYAARRLTPAEARAILGETATRLWWPPAATAVRKEVDR